MKKLENQSVPSAVSSDLEDKKQQKSRHWCFVLYPESAPENWKDIINESYLPWSCSPLHDSDINEGTGEKKKAHYHIILSYDGPTTFTLVKKLTDSLNCPIPIKCNSLKGAYDYFTHKNNPDKFQYDKKDILIFNGFEVALSQHEINNLLSALTDIIFEKNFVEYASLIYYVKYVLFDDDLAQTAATHTIYLNALIKSLRHRKNTVDEETGEVYE